MEGKAFNDTSRWQGSSAKKKKTYKISKCIGETTNNISEYLALIYALQELLPTKVKSLVVKSDSQLLVKQLNKEYKVKDKNIKLFFGLASNLIDSFKNFSLIQIDRSRNKEADRLASESINVLF